MKEFYTLVVSEKKLNSRDQEEIAEAVDVMQVPNKLNVHTPDYLVMNELFESLGTVNESGNIYPDLIGFIKRNYEMFKKYNAIYVRITDDDWKRMDYKSNTYGASNVYNGIIISTVGRWHQFSRYKRAYKFPDPFNKLSEQALGIWHEFMHGVCRVVGLDAYAWTHTFFYGYDRLYTKAQEKELNPERYVKTPNPWLAWQVLPFANLPDAQRTIPIPIDENFEKAVEVIFMHEGGYANNPKDPGGETNFGISKRSYPHLDIKKLTKQEAKEIYYKDYWLACSCNKMSYKSAVAVFDMGVNAGTKTSIKLIQKALGIKADGIVGPITLDALSKADDKLFISFAWQRMLYYEALSTFSTFGKGWTNRTFKTLLESLN